MQVQRVAGPLEGLRVLDLGRFIAGPYCGMILGDLGADVVKLERPHIGEDARSAKPRFSDGESFYFLVFNRNKRSVTLNFRSEEGQQLLRELAAKTDVLIENFRAGTMEKMGCGWEELSAINPRLIMARASGFGQEGPYADRICTDTIAQAMGGLMDLTGDAEGPPVVCGTYVVDYATALYATIGILSALQHRAATGKGQVVDVALLDTAVSMLVTALVEYGVAGEVLTRIGNHDRFSTPSNTFRTSDGHWVHIIGAAAHFHRLTAVIGRDDLLDDERYATVERRLEHRTELNALVEQWVAERSREEVVHAMAEANVLCSPVAGVKDVFENPQLRHRRQIVDVEHPVLGSFPMQGVTIQLGESPAAIRRSPPLLGEHTAEVLSEWLGYEGQQIEVLQRRGAI